MNNRRSYLDAMNAGRRRRPSTSLEQLSQTLDELESRIARPPSSRGGDGATRRADAPRPARLSEPRDDHRIADEIGALREELRQQMGAGLRQEFSTLKAEIERALRTSGKTGQTAELGAEFERLSAMIHNLSRQGDDRQVQLLRLEMEEVKNSLGKLAREETVQSFDRRWDDFDRRWSDIEDKIANAHRAAPNAALEALTARLEQIGDQVNALPTSVVLRSLEDRMQILSATVDQFAHQHDRVGAEAFDAIGERLDEISRAISASSAAPRPLAFDPEPFERIEARISSLARQIDEATEESSTNALADQLAALSHRVEDLAHRVDLPEHTVMRLAGQIETIAGRLEEGPATHDLDNVFQGLETRFAALSAMLEQRHEDALTQGQSLFRDLERRLDDVAERVRAEAHHGNDGADLLDAMDARFAEFASRLEQKAPADDRAMRDLEARLETISSRIDATARDSVDPTLIHSLESQIAGLAAHLTQPAAAPEIADIRPRLDKIEQSIAASRQDVIEAARHAAEEAVRSFSGSAGESAHVAGLAEDLKSLEALTRKSDDRNAKTFEAIHDTLLKIVDRLGALEAVRASGRDTLAETPSLDLSETMPLAAPLAGSDHGGRDAVARSRPRTAATAAAEAAADAMRGEAEAAAPRRSMLGGLTRALSGRKGRQEKPEEDKAAVRMPAASQLETAPTIEVDAPIDPLVANQPLEPGSGAPDLNAIMKRVRDERGQPARGPETDAAKSDFIAAARRAAQAAAAEAEMMKRGTAAKGKSEGLGLGRLFGAKRKMVLMGVGAVLLALAALQGGRALIGSDGGQTTQTAAIESPSVAPEPILNEPAVEIAGDAGTQPVRMIGEDAEATTAHSAMTNVPENAAAVTTDWLDTTSTIPTVTPSEPVAEMESAAEPDEVTFASIPVTAGPVALREAAAAGDPKALYEIGNRFAEGRGVTADMSAAAEWYEKAAEHGLAPAQYRIGNLYEKGGGVTRDVNKAKTWYQLAAAQGNASAMHNLAVLHAMGADGVADNETAARWFSQAAEFGVRDSQYNLGILTAKGVGMQQNLEAAYKWFALVAKSGDKDAAEKRDEVARSLSPEQLEKARAATELWRAKPVDEEANAVEIPESWSESTETTASVDIRQAVRNIQQILNKHGYDAGGADGLMGQKTQRAIAAFQKDKGMEPTGEVDEALVRALLELG